MTLNQSAASGQTPTATRPKPDSSANRYAPRRGRRQPSPRRARGPVFRRTARCRAAGRSGPAAAGAQGNPSRRALEGKQHADRDAQFKHINRRVRAFQRLRQPVVSVDTKKKELIGQFRNGGREWRPQGDPQRVKVHDFVDKELGKAIPYGVYEVTNDSGWVSVGEDHDKPAFAVETLRRWWHRMGRVAYPQDKRLLITADGGGSNSSRSRLWKAELQKFADASGLCISVCHFLPGTSKWNKIEHRMFCHIAENWRGRPLTSREVVVNLIGHTTTKQGLTVHSELDENSYPTGRSVSDEEMEGLNLKRDKSWRTELQTDPATLINEHVILATRLSRIRVPLPGMPPQRPPELRVAAGGNLRIGLPLKVAAHARHSHDCTSLVRW